MARVKKFELRPLDQSDSFSVYVHGKWRGLVQKSGRSHTLHLGRNDITNFASKKALEEWLLAKWSN